MTAGDHDVWLWQLAPEAQDPAGSRASVPTTLPCPEWCALPEGHSFESFESLTQESTNGGNLLRIHRERFGEKPTHVALETYERAVSPSGPSDLGMDAAATLVRLQFPHACGYLTPDGARRLAALLLDAAETARRSSCAGAAETPDGDTARDETGGQQ